MIFVNFLGVISVTYSIIVVDIMISEKCFPCVMKKVFHRLIM